MPAPISTASFATQLAALLGLNSTNTTALIALMESWDPTTPSDLAAVVQAFVTSTQQRDTDLNNWATGTATGGDGAGNYSITLLGGGSTTIPSVAKLLTEVTHGADAQTGLAFRALGPWNPNEMLDLLVVPGALVINTAAIVGYALTAPTGSVTITFEKNGAAWGTVTFSAAQHNQITASFSSNNVAAGDVITWFAPGSGDATFLNFGITLPGVSG